MTEEKGLDPASADKIGEYVKYKGEAEGVIFVLSIWLSITFSRWPGLIGATSHRRHIDRQLKSKRRSRRNEDPILLS